MTQVTLAIVVLSLIGIAFLWLKIGLRGLLLIGGALLIVVVFGFLSLFSYQQFNGRTLVATVRATQVSNQDHTMVVNVTTNGTERTYEIGGDEWSLQASVIEYQSWLNWCGLHNGVTLNRIDSEYNDTSHENIKPVLLNGGGGSFYESIGALTRVPFIKSAYGSAVVEVADGREYNVYADSVGDLIAERK